MDARLFRSAYYFICFARYYFTGKAYCGFTEKKTTHAV